MQWHPYLGLLLRHQEAVETAAFLPHSIQYRLRKIQLGEKPRHIGLK